MRNIEKYYENTVNALPHNNVIEFINVEKNVGKAIELGCGAGRDSVYLIKNGWEVIGIDREDTKQIIIEKLNEKEIDKFTFIQSEFENVNLEKNKLVVANYSIPFCNKNKFNELWHKVISSIEKNGHFVGNFFGKNDSWNKRDSELVFLEKIEVEKLFKDFEILKIEEEEKDAKTGLGIMKHWHTYTIIARKR